MDTHSNRLEGFGAAMRLALVEADRAAKASGDVPVGAVLLNPAGQVIAKGRNEKELHKDPTAHAEIVAIREATRVLNDWHLDGCTLVVTLEPCAMCAAAIVAARIPCVVFGAWDERVGAAGSLYDIVRDPRLGKPAEVIGGVLEAECSKLLKDFFATAR
ncbi:MAG: nucleoside deaminase [Micrococcales bacterium]